MASRVRRPSLDAVLAYRNSDVVDRFLAEWDVTPREARLLFDDMLRFLWLSMRSEHMVAPVRIIDIMWHTFLVFTESYANWSRATFGRMLHHIPTTEREKRVRKNRQDKKYELPFDRAGDRPTRSSSSGARRQVPKAG